MINAVGSVRMLCMNATFILRLFWLISYCYLLFLIILSPLFLFLLFLNVCHACIIFIIPVFILSFCNGVFLYLPFWLFLQHSFIATAVKSVSNLVHSSPADSFISFKVGFFCNRKFLLSVDCVLQNEWHHCCIVTDDVTHCAMLSSALKETPFSCELWLHTLILSDSTLILSQY